MVGGSDGGVGVSGVGSGRLMVLVMVLWGGRALHGMECRVADA